MWGPIQYFYSSNKINGLENPFLSSTNNLSYGIDIGGIYTASNTLGYADEIAYSPTLNRYLTVGQPVGIYYSDNSGRSWTNYSLGVPSIASGSINSIVWTGSVFLIQGLSNALLPFVYSSPTGLSGSWTAKASPSFGGFKMAYSPTLGRVVVTNGGNSNRIEYSDNGGTSWTTVGKSTTLTSRVWWCDWLNIFILFNSTLGDGIFGPGAPYQTSGDATAWTDRTLPNLAGPEVVDFVSVGGGKIFIEYRDTNTQIRYLYYSTDAINWTLITSSGSALGGLIPRWSARNGKFVRVVGSSVQVSNDGLNDWTQIASGTFGLQDENATY